jgi:hypothetical protein
MAAYAARTANHASDNVRADYFYGKSDGINAVDRFLRGDKSKMPTIMQAMVKFMNLVES